MLIQMIELNKWGQIDKFSMQKTLNNFCQYSALKEVKCHFPLIMCGLYIVTPFQRQHCEKVEGSNFTIETPAKRPQG